MRPRPRRRGRQAASPGLVPLLRDLVWLAVGLGLLAPLAQGLVQRLPAVAAPALIARLQAAERRGEAEGAGPVLHLLPGSTPDDRGACAPALPDHRARPAAVRVVVLCPDGSSCVARGRAVPPR